MGISEDWLQLAVGAVIGFVFKVVVGLINKNEVKSDEANHKQDARSDQIEHRTRNNDRELYKEIAVIREKIAYAKGVDDTRKEMGAFNNGNNRT